MAEVEVVKGVAPVLPDAQMHLVKPTQPVIGRIAGTNLCMRGKSASFIRHVQIDVSGTPLEDNFLIGQSFGVVPPGEDERGKPHKVRLYSIACPSWGEDGAGKIVSTTPKRVIDERTPQKDGDDPDDHALFTGVCSNYLCDLRVGDEVQVSGPNGRRFLLPTDPSRHDYLFIATGTGIAPFRGMAMELLQHPDGPCKSQIHLVMGTPYRGDLLYDDLFVDLAAKHDNFYYHTAISREPYKGGERGVYVDGFIEDNLDVFGPLIDSPRTLIYMCGLIGMQFGMYKVFARHNLGEGYVMVKDDIADTPIDDWDTLSMRRHIKPTPRCMLEVY